MIFNILFKQQLSIFMYNQGYWLNPLLFYILVGSLFAIATTGLKIMPTIVSPVILVSLLLSTLMSTDTLFRYEYDCGLLEQIELSSIALWQWCLMKILINWLLVTAPLLMISPVLALMFSFPLIHLPLLLLILFMSSFCFYFIGSIGSALLVSLPNAGLLLALLIIPLYIPILIFALSGLQANISGVDNNALLWLLSLMLLSLTLSPVISGVSLKLSITNR